MRVLELLCGTKSIGHAFESQGFEVVSLDKDPKFEPTICSDILQWDYKEYPPGFFDVIWASPECTPYSIARSKAKTPRNLEYADSLVKRALKIIRHHNPRSWFLDNPASGLLKSRECMYLIPCITVSYCKYGYPYKKNSMIWGLHSISNGEPHAAVIARLSRTASIHIGHRRQDNMELAVLPKYNLTKCPLRSARTSLMRRPRYWHFAQ